mmetsp:Transcript_25269/g.51570  ORF Transcript_25269/g.51570 Transcript_25269/m.51570 type:complete len:233 (+) Transcript_25269:577-1275(+)
MRHVGGTDLVVKEIDQAEGIELVVRTIDGVEGAADVGVILGGEVGDVDVGVLEPCVQHQPSVDHNQRSTVQRHHLRQSVARRPSHQTSHRRRDSHVALQDLLLPISREQFLLRHGGFRQRIGPVVIRHASGRSAGGADQQVRGPSHDEVEETLQDRPGLDAVVRPQGFDEGCPKAVTAVRVVLHGFRDVRLAQVHVIGVLMMDGVTPLPGVIRDQKEGMQHEPHGVLNALVL